MGLIDTDKFLSKLDPDEYYHTNEIRAMVADTLAASNEPLTLEELREMGGEPVWLRGNGLNRWYIFDGFSLDGIPFFTPEIGYGKPWIAYRRKPEDGI